MAKKKKRARKPLTAAAIARRERQRLADIARQDLPTMPWGTHKCATCEKDFECKTNRRVSRDGQIRCVLCARRVIAAMARQQRAELAAKARGEVEMTAAEQREAERIRVREIREAAAAQHAREMLAKQEAEAKKVAEEELMIFREHHQKTEALLTPDEVQEIVRNCTMIRAATDHLSTAELVQREMVVRELCKRKLIYFIVRMRPEYEAGWFNIELAERLERFYRAILRRESPRLLLAAPPRHGKSMEVSEYGPAWFIGIGHEHGIRPEAISSSYNDDLASDFSRSVQNIMREPFYKALFDGLTVSDWSKGIDAWETSKHGKYRGTGVGGSLTGRGAHLLNIEDPFKNRQDADSAVVRKRVWDWYTSTAYTRLLPGGGVLVCATRWSTDDLSGRLIEQYKLAEREFAKTGTWPADADRWEIVSYPAVAVEDEVHRREGEALHPERYPIQELLRIRRTLTVDGDPRDWAALYQQTPIADEGAYFSKEMLHFFEGDMPAGMVLAGGDLALSKEQWADNSVILFAVLDAEDNLLVFDGVRDKMDSGEIMDMLFDKQEEHKVKEFGLGKDVIEKSLGPMIDREIVQKRRYELVITPMPHNNQDKAVHARAAQGRMKRGKLKFRRGAEFLTWLLPELLAFPNGRKDDVVDALANLARLANDRIYTAPPEPHKKSWRDRLNALASGTSTNSSMAA